MPRNPSPVATQRSIDPSPDRRKTWIGALKALILVATFAWVGRMLVNSVRAVQSGNLTLSVTPELLALSAALVIVAFGVLIASWLYVLEGLSGKRVPFLVGARIWFISGLGVYLPGRVWGIVQMAAMSAEEDINPVAAGAASVINAAVNIATGMAVGVIAGTSIVAAYSDSPAVAWALSIAAIAGILLLPTLLPMAFRFARGRFNASVPDESTPTRLILVSVVANVASWFLFGGAFMCLALGILDLGPQSLLQHTAAYATSYVIGYMSIVTPAGMGVREESLERILQFAGIATSVQGTAIAVVSRLWLLIIQVLPALIFLAYRRPRNEKDPAAG